MNYLYFFMLTIYLTGDIETARPPAPPWSSWPSALLGPPGLLLARQWGSMSLHRVSLAQSLSVSYRPLGGPMMSPAFCLLTSVHRRTDRSEEHFQVAGEWHAYISPLLRGTMAVSLKGPLWGLIVTRFFGTFQGFWGDFEGQFWVKGFENHWKSTKKH